MLSLNTNRNIYIFNKRAVKTLSPVKKIGYVFLKAFLVLVRKFVNINIHQNEPGGWPYLNRKVCENVHFFEKSSKTILNIKNLM